MDPRQHALYEALSSMEVLRAARRLSDATQVPVPKPPKPATES